MAGTARLSRLALVRTIPKPSARLSSVALVAGSNHPKARLSSLSLAYSPGVARARVSTLSLALPSPKTTVALTASATTPTSVVSLNATATTVGGVSVTGYAWSAVTPGAPTLNGTTIKNPQFLAPVLSTATSFTYRCVVTTSDGLNTSSNVTVTVPASNARVYDSVSQTLSKPAHLRLSFPGVPTQITPPAGGKARISRLGIVTTLQSGTVTSTSTSFGVDISTNGADLNNERGVGVHWNATNGRLETTTGAYTFNDVAQFPGTLTDCRLDYRGRYGVAMPHIKWYDYGNGIAAAMNNWRNYGDPTDPLPVICFKSYTQAAFNDALNTFGALGMNWVAVYWQEPQADSASGAQPAAYLQAYADMDAFRKNNDYGKYCYLLKNLAGFPQLVTKPTGRMWQDYDGGQRFDRMFVGSDLYSSNSRATPYTPSGISSWLVDWSNTAGVPPVVPEFGLDAFLNSSSTVGTTSIAPYGKQMPDATRASYLQKYIDYWKTNKFGWANYWLPNSGSTSTNNWNNWELPIGSVSESTWKTAMTGG